MSYGETSPLIGGSEKVVVYKRRWYILTLFSCLAMLQNTVWNTWGPILETVPSIFPWTNQTVALLINWGDIVFILMMLPLVYLIEHSIRVSVLLTSLMIAAGTTLRCLPLVVPDLPDSVFTLLCHVCAILNGVAGIVVCSAPPAIAAAWFPPRERVTATSIGQMMNTLGGGLSYFMASSFVEENIGTESKNTSSCGIPSTPPTSNDSSPPSNSSQSYGSPGSLRSDIFHYMASLSIPALILFILTIIYFPSKPKSPPSRSSTMPRESFLNGCKKILLNPTAWQLAMIWSLPQAVMQTWTAVMVANLTKIGYQGVCLSEEWVNHLAIVTCVCGTFTAILVAKLSDRIRVQSHSGGRLKPLILILLSLAAITFFLLSLIELEVVIFTDMFYLRLSIYVLLILGISLTVSTSPLSVELAAEALYPVAEAAVGGWLNLWYYSFSMVFLFTVDLGTSWLNYVLPLTCVLTIPLVATLNEEHKRSSQDAWAECCNETSPTRSTNQTDQHSCHPSHGCWVDCYNQTDQHNCQPNRSTNGYHQI